MDGARGERCRGRGGSCPLALPFIPSALRKKIDGDKVPSAKV